MNNLKRSIYLAGGFRGGWHDSIIKQLGDSFIFYNPKSHNLESPNKYTHWDLFHIDKCDILLGYMSKDNPSGYGLALEIGYAKAKDKLIVLIDERSKVDQSFARYFAICNECADVICHSLEETAKYLNDFL